MTGPLQIVLSPAQLAELASMVAAELRGQSTLAQGLTLQQAAARLSVSRATLQRMIADGRIAASKVGRRTIVKATEVDRLLSVSVDRTTRDDDDAAAIARAMLDRPARRRAGA